MSEGPAKPRWAQFSLRELIVCLTWYGIYAGIVTGFRPSDKRLFVFLMIGPVIGLLIPGSVVLFAPKQRRWLMPIAIGFVCIVGGAIGLWLAMLNAQSPID
jgi:uncharacterized membrane protein YoaT (DUF817 family)